MLERFRKSWSWLLTPVARRLLGLGLSADAVTWIGTGLAVFFAFLCFPQGWLWQGAMLVGLAVVSDSIDGTMARIADSSSAWGAFLDSTLDRIVDGAVFAAIIIWFAGGGDSLLGVSAGAVALVAGQLTSYVKARGEAAGAGVTGGVIARADRLLIVLLGALLTGFGLSGALEFAVLVLAAAGTLTVAQRMRQVAGQLRGSSGPR